MPAAARAILTHTFQGLPFQVEWPYTSLIISPSSGWR